MAYCVSCFKKLEYFGSCGACNAEKQNEYRLARLKIGDYVTVENENGSYWGEVEAVQGNKILFYGKWISKDNIILK